MNYTEILLTALTFITGVLAVVTFFVNRRHDHQNEGETAGTLHADIKYIKEVLIDVRSETKEINKLLDNHSIALAKAQNNIANAHKRIDEAIARIERLEKEKR